MIKGLEDFPTVPESGQWIQFQQKPIGNRQAKGLVKYVSPVKAQGGEEFIVAAIVGKRQVKVVTSIN